VSKPDAPAPPDYTGAAQAQGTANLDSAIATGVLNRPNQVSPLGSQTWNQTGSYQVGDRAVPIFTGTTSFTPQGQKLYDTGVQTQQAMGDLGLQAANKGGQILGQTFDVGSIPGIDKTPIDRNSVRDALVARASDQNTRDISADRSQLIAQGIPVGSEAFNQQMALRGRQMNDARQQAELGAGQAQQQAMAGRQQLIQEALLQRQTPLNEIASLRSGSQIQTPQFGAQTQAGTVAPAPIFGATQAAGTFAQQNYQNQVAAQNGLISGAAQLGAGMSGSSAPWWMAAA
jgi:hypothetical protein